MSAAPQASVHINNLLPSVFLLTDKGRPVAWKASPHTRVEHTAGFRRVSVGAFGPNLLFSYFFSRVFFLSSEEFLLVEVHFFSK